ncbi:MAG: hypothetical protein ACE5IZ_01455 [Dehalococcoidia bacterium]
MAARSREEFMEQLLEMDFEPRPRRAKEPGKESAVVTCGYCGGAGANPPTSTCPACGGRGYNRITLPYTACPVCEGEGDVDSSRLTCARYGGRGVVTVREEQEQMAGVASGAAGDMVDVKCGYCWGRGKDPFGCPSPQSNCSVCGGRGINRVTAPFEVCGACRGTGKAAGRRLTCSSCKGKGVKSIRVPTQTCQACRGTGYQGDRACPECGGRGGLKVRLNIQRIPPPSVVVGGEDTATGRRARTQRMMPTGPAVVSEEDRISVHITNFPGVKVADVQALFGLSKGEAERRLQHLVQVRKIKEKEGGLYYPA